MVAHTHCRHLHPSPRAQSSKDFIAFHPAQSSTSSINYIHIQTSLYVVFIENYASSHETGYHSLSPDEAESRKTMCDAPMEVAESSALEFFTSVHTSVDIKRRWIDTEEGERNGFR